jgi:hypothetical protein
MRLYEFTDPTKYLLLETNVTDTLKQSKNTRTADAADDASHHLKKKPSTKTLSDRL